MGFYADTTGVLTIGILFPVLCIGSVILRFYSRKHKRITYGVEDWMALLALVFTVACGAIMIAGAATHTVGWLTTPLTKKQDYTQGYLQYSFLILQVPAVAFIRLTFLYLYRRVFSRTVWGTGTLVVIGITVAWAITFFFAMLFQCGSHIDAIGAAYSIYVEYCSLSPKLATGMAVSDAIIDALILIYPIYPICHLQINTRRKLMILALFSLATFSVVVSFIKMVIFLDLDKAPDVPAVLFGLDTDTETSESGFIALTLWWNYLQIGVGCWASNLPAIVGTVAEIAIDPLRILYSRVSDYSRSFTTSPHRGSSASSYSQRRRSAMGKQAAGSIHDQGSFEHELAERSAAPKQPAKV